MRIVCIVDDDEAIRDSMRLLIESYGMGVREYPSATAYLNDMPPSGSACLLLDLHMPGMSGLELIELLRRRRIDTPAIMITGRSDPALSDRIDRAGILALLHKPVGDEDLMAYIERAFNANRNANKPQSSTSVS